MPMQYDQVNRLYFQTNLDTIIPTEPTSCNTPRGDTNIPLPTIIPTIIATPFSRPSSFFNAILPFFDVDDVESNGDDINYDSTYNVGTPKTNISNIGTIYFDLK
ncbi:hypothetical protein DERP_014954 [Dermatophagoides pteronyssinus]|uniref:Uncharacterized protein n=1 Tax=Dermatophagoides pteronyssinus TaxID=6956 RepID=A0ABQ8JGH1_DERPT|nr:hypothetical protein DERP_014954 [Dermatophagoides pteronyssinus]